MTGVLGTYLSQLGRFELGTAPNLSPTASVTTNANATSTASPQASGIPIFASTGSRSAATSSASFTLDIIFASVTTNANATSVVDPGQSVTTGAVATSTAAIVETNEIIVTRAISRSFASSSSGKLQSAKYRR